MNWDRRINGMKSIQESAKLPSNCTIQFQTYVRGTYSLRAVWIDEPLKPFSDVTIQNRVVILTGLLSKD